MRHVWILNSSRRLVYSLSCATTPRLCHTATTCAVHQIAPNILRWKQDGCECVLDRRINRRAVWDLGVLAAARKASRCCTTQRKLAGPLICGPPCRGKGGTGGAISLISYRGVNTVRRTLQYTEYLLLSGLRLPYTIIPLSFTPACG